MLTPFPGSWQHLWLTSQRNPPLNPPSDLLGMDILFKSGCEADTLLVQSVMDILFGQDVRK